jgi:hypothetical protein
MKYVSMAIALAMASYAQSAMGQVNLADPGLARPVTQEEIEQKQRMEKAYRDSLRKIPEQKATNDPWGGVRDVGTSSSKNTSKR